MQRTKQTFRTIRKAGLVCAIFCLALLVTSCTMTMRDQPRVDPYEPSAFFGGEQSALLPVADTVPVNGARTDDALYTGQVDGQYVEEFPFLVTKEGLEYGRQRYDIYCAPCHGYVGDGDGMVVQRGFKDPPSLNQDRLREAAPGYFFYAITNGFGSMPSYANRIPVHDRWLIVAYVKALQLSQHVLVTELPADDQAKVEAAQ